MADRALEIVSMKNPAEIGLDPSLLNAGDKIIEVAGEVAADQLDFHYHASLGETVKLRVERSGGRIDDVVIAAEDIDRLDIVFKAMDFRRCRCKCPFCFVDQMPKGLRKSLYIKDEDFRLSFLYGNFTTMNDITDEELDKIIRQNNSPQWVSVHAVDRDMREYIFGRPMKRDIIETLSVLAGAGIAVHTQAVIVPGKNDGGYLRDTIETLEAVHENIRTLAVVPVGLTGYREGLPRLRKFEPREMEKILNLVEPYGERYLAGPRNSRFVFPSDEWYLGAGRGVPGDDSYEGYPQIDNGVGMVRQLVTDLEEELEDTITPDFMDRITIVTGELGETVFRDYVFPLLESRGADSVPALVVAANHFFGTSVTVSGLLVGEDIIRAVRESTSRERIKESVTLIPENCLNHEGVTIDGMDVEAMGKALGGRVAAAEGSLVQSLVAAAGGEG